MRHAVLSCSFMCCALCSYVLCAVLVSPVPCVLRACAALCVLRAMNCSCVCCVLFSVVPVCAVLCSALCLCDNRWVMRLLLVSRGNTLSYHTAGQWTKLEPGTHHQHHHYPLDHNHVSHLWNVHNFQDVENTLKILKIINILFRSWRYIFCPKCPNRNIFHRH